MRGYGRFLFPGAVALMLFLGSDVFQVRSAGANPPSTAQDVNVVGPLTNNGSVPVEATVKGIVKTRANPALTHVGALASDIVTLTSTGGVITEVRSDGSTSTFSAAPSGKALVITDVEWTGTGSAGNNVVLGVYAGACCAQTLFAVYERYNENGYASRTSSMTTGNRLRTGHHGVLRWHSFRPRLLRGHSVGFAPGRPVAI